MYDSRVIPFYQARELELMPLEMVLVNFDQLRRLAETRCPCCGEKGLVVDSIDIRPSSSPADIGDLQAQHAALRNGRFEISGVFDVVCIYCDDFAQTGFIYIESGAESVSEDDAFVQA